MRSVLAVLDFPPRLGYPNGFSGRTHRFLARAAESAALHVLGLRVNDARWTKDEFLPPDVPAKRLWWADVESNPLNQIGWAGRVKRLRHYAFDHLPYMSWPRETSAVKRVVEAVSPGVVVVFLPYLAHLALDLPPSLATILVLEEGWERSLDWTTRELPRPLRMWVRKGESRRIDRLYRDLAARRPQIVVISQGEATWFSRWFPRDSITVIEHGVDCEYFAPLRERIRHDVGVFGNFSDGRVVDDGLHLWRQLEEAAEGDGLRWCFVGAAPPLALRDLQNHGVTVTGYVSDIRPYYAGTKVVVVPAAYGTGVKTTVLEAWAMARPVVISSHAAEGLPVRHGVNALVAGSVPEAAARVMDVLASPDLARRLASAGLETVRRQRDIRILATKFGDLLSWEK